MSCEISYETVSDVSASWDRLKLSQKNYQERFGELIFSHLFELEPEILKLFKFSDLKSPEFVAHAKVMVDMLDCVVGFLGPELDPLKKDLQRLGKRHFTYGVTADYLPEMESAVLYAFDQMLGKKLSRNERNAWQALFYFMIKHMANGMYA